ncbi:MAG: lysophospholipid acyltransferase family protein [Gemmatimonadaceae bacterium]
MTEGELVRSGDARANRLGLAQRVAIAVGPLVLRALYATWRVKVLNDGGWRALRAAGQPFVFSLWHGELLPLVIEHRNQGVRILISEHGDGEVIAQIARRLGLASIRGSSSRGAARALLAMCDALRDGAEVAVTPDGPRGPAHKYAGGALVAAQRSRAPIVAIRVAVSNAWRLRSWDAFMIPKPFAVVTIAYSDPVYVEAADARAAAEQTARFEELMEATAECAHLGSAAGA